MFFTKPLSELNAVPRTPSNPAEDPRLLEAAKKRRQAKFALDEAAFQERQYREAHRHDPRPRPYMVTDGRTTKFFTQINTMRDESPQLKMLCGATRAALDAFNEAQRIEAEVMQELGLLKTGGNT